MNSNNFQPSLYQQKIFDWVVSGRGDAVVEAVAGSGKTTTLVEAAKLLHSQNAIFLAFNKHITKELQQRLGKTMTCKTIHSVGYGCLSSYLGKLTVEENKYDELAKPYAEEIAQILKQQHYQALALWQDSLKQNPDASRPEEPPNIGQVIGQLKRLAHFIRVTLTPVNDRIAVEEVCDHFTCLDSAFTVDLLHYSLISMLRVGKQLAENRRIVDYDDLLWLNYEWEVQPKKCEWIFVDEAQDLSPAQLDLVLKLRGAGGRILFVGDKNQAIFGFAGAASDSIDQIIERTNATTLPLSICYRCPKSHVKLAQKIVSQIEPATNAVEGVIETIPYKKVYELFEEGDLVVSRRTAPAIKLCIELISKRIPARVRGRDIGKSLTTMVKEIANVSNFDFRKFGNFLREYIGIKINKLSQGRNAQARIQSLTDRAEGIRVCYENFTSKTLEEFCNEIENLFSDTRSSVVLSTIHKSKGLENDRVFILEPNYLPLRWKGQQKWEKSQELNLTYVAYTRAKKALYFIETSEKDDQNNDVEEE